MSVRADEPVKPFGLGLRRRRLRLGAGLLAGFSCGLKRALWASRRSDFSFAVMRFGSGVFGAGRNLSRVVGALSFHLISTPGGRPLSVQDLFHFSRLLTSLVRWSKDFDGGASASMLEKSPFSYCTFTACFTRRSSPILRMWPSHSCFRLRIARTTSKVRLFGLASVWTSLTVIREISLALTPLIAAVAALVSRQASQP